VSLVILSSMVSGEVDPVGRGHERFRREAYQLN